MHDAVQKEIDNPKFSQIKMVAFDHGGTFSIDLNSVRFLVQRRLKLEDMGVNICLLQVDRQTDHFLVEQGVKVKTFRSSDAMQREFPDLAGRKNTNIDTGFVNTFIDTAINTLKVQCRVEAKAGKPFIRKGADDIVIGIAGIIALTSKKFNSSITLCFLSKTFLAVMETMFEESFAFIDNDLEDRAGELLNIIFGQAKAKLNESAQSIEKAIPTVVSGDSLKVSSLELSKL